MAPSPDSVNSLAWPVGRGGLGENQACAGPIWPEAHFQVLGAMGGCPLQSVAPADSGGPPLNSQLSRAPHTPRLVGSKCHPVRPCWGPFSPRGAGRRRTRLTRGLLVVPTLCVSRHSRCPGPCWGSDLTAQSELREKESGGDRCLPAQPRQAGERGRFLRPRAPKRPRDDAPRRGRLG